MARQHWPISQSHGELNFSWRVPHMPSLFASVLAAPCAAKQAASSTKQKVRKPQVNQPKATQKQGPVKPQRSGMAPSARPLTKSKAPASRSRHGEKLSPLSLWHSFGKRWQAGPGSHVLPSHVSGASRKHVWLEWRSTGMGCTLCHWFWQRYQTEKRLSRQKWFCTKWGRFQVSSLKSMQSSCVRNHAISEVHQTAWASFCNPGIAGVLVQLADEDSHLLRGGVPQPGDWLRLWRAIRSTSVSIRGLQDLSFTDSFVSCDRADVKAVSREAYLKMIYVMVDILRENKRALLRRARAIAISTDDKSTLAGS